jgi:hypothetical protein
MWPSPVGLLAAALIVSSSYVRVFSLLLEGSSFEGCRASVNRSGWPMIIPVFATLDGARFWHQLIRHNTTKIDEALFCWSSFGFRVDLPFLYYPKNWGIK